MAYAFVHHPLCFLFLFLRIASPILAQNISLGWSLTASSKDSPWLSPSGDFAFGFRSIGTKGFLLCIWFNRIPEQTIVWSANGDKLVEKGSKVELTNDGMLALLDHQGRKIWTANTSNGRAAYASMLDTGNFILRGEGSVNVWESFDQPTDTVLPSQVLNQGDNLISRQTENNYSNGRFQLRLQLDGNLVLYTLIFPSNFTYDPYWESNTVKSGSQLIFNQSGLIYLTQTNGSLLNLTPPQNAVSSNTFYQRATLDFDGVLRQYVYPKTSTNGRWLQSWSTVWVVPSNICLSISGRRGSGACGFNSYCILDQNRRPSCECPPGYTYFDPDNEWNGCKPNFLPQRCDETEGLSLFDMREMRDTDWPMHDYEKYESVSEDWCREACLSDCFCSITFYREATCWKKGLPLANGRIDTNLQGKALIKVRTGNSSLNTESGKKKDDSTKLVLLGGSVILNIIFLLVIPPFTIWTYRRRLVRVEPKISDMNLRAFTYKELQVATTQFKEELGQGASATVYKGILTSGNGTSIAVKRLDKIVREVEKEFLTEVTAIGRTNHKNLVQLLGFCDEGPNRLLVYEFMSNGSLAGQLFGITRPDWGKRIEIACGVARGLTYLHEECITPTIHCDIKPQNILLDDTFTALISDFGLAKLLRFDQTQTTTGIRGTKGYVAPEWFSNKPITAKVDVYSFGIMLLEIICCRKNVEPELKDECRTVLTEWAYDCFLDGELYALVEHDDKAMEDIKGVERLVMVALWCIYDEPSLRPTMKKVCQMLEGVAEVPIPPSPSSFSNSTSIGS